MPPHDLDWTEEERELLRSAGPDAPAPGARAKTLAGLGIGMGGAALGSAAVSGSAHAAQLVAKGGAAATAASGGGKALLLGKWLMLLSVAGAAGGAALHYRTQLATSAPVPAPAPARTTPVTAALPAPPAAEPEAALPAVAPEAVPTALKPTATTPKTEPDLALEIASLDRARRAADHHDFGTALRELDDYDHTFKTGRLRQEALLLRVQTLLGKGDTGAAKALGGRFLARYPKSPLAPRIQKLIGAD